MSYHSWPWRDRAGKSRGDIVRCLDLEIQRLRSEREELLGALRGMVRQHGGCLLDPPCGDCITCNAERTLAKAEGRTP